MVRKRCFHMSSCRRRHEHRVADQAAQESRPDSQPLDSEISLLYASFPMVEMVTESEIARRASQASHLLRCQDLPWSSLIRHLRQSICRTRHIELSQAQEHSQTNLAPHATCFGESVQASLLTVSAQPSSQPAPKRANEMWCSIRDIRH